MKTIMLLLLLSSSLMMTSPFLDSLSHNSPFISLLANDNQEPIVTQAPEGRSIPQETSQSEEVTIEQHSHDRVIINGYDYDLGGLHGLTCKGSNNASFVLWPSSLSSSSSSLSSSSSPCNDAAVYKVMGNTSNSDSFDKQCIGYGSVKTGRFVSIDQPIPGRDLNHDEYMSSSKFNEGLDEEVIRKISSSTSSLSSTSSSSKKGKLTKLIAISYHGSHKNRMTSALVFLTCDIFRTKGLLRIIWQSKDQTSVHLELFHTCCCPDACSKPTTIADKSDRLLQPNVTKPDKNDEDDNDDDDDADDDAAADDDGDDDDADDNYGGVHRFVIKPTTSLITDDVDDDNDVLTLTGESHTYIWIIIIINVAIVTGAIFIAAFCCRRAGFASADGPYNYLPKPWSNQISVHSSRNSIYQFAGKHSIMDSPMDDGDYDDRLPLPTNMASAKSRDYLTSREQQESQLMSLTEAAECHVIQCHNLDLRQRLGGGFFGDSYMAVWGKRKVVAKRIVVGLHGNQLESVDVKLKRIIQSVTQLAKVRHRNLVMVLGVCVETKRPYVIQEFVEGACLKALLRNDGTNGGKNGCETGLTWKKKLKIGRQIAEGMSYLHSLDPPLLHRDLRCGNVFLDTASKVKLVDFGLTRIYQTLRNQCEGEKNCFCQKSTSAYPSTIRWTAPEILKNPRSEEPFGYYFRSTSTIAASAHSSFRSLVDPTAATTSSSSESVLDFAITPACDVYSFGMVMWEVASHTEPFGDVAEEDQVIKLVLGGYRPGLKSDLSSKTIYPSSHYRDLMEICWDVKPEQRPTFKQVLVTFKSMVQMADSKLESKLTETQVDLENATNYYLKSALNVQ